ncbi:DeoR/GlpR family DNA-binding transcription regulator [Priestia taiwanensis]|uniref:DeoR family transcriptional regulator n=1 Tax=Priestia taiwanensis TaxID=1347902 RepID=A0A917EP20_9BACI|nr:DeoR/GlpR family DNA-binding transcription regulator [Priestia taiwanensis]MBM7363837.1 DeoR family fructose operon transcriptional repressor [Priestia taiwanensis]GGE69399.1 DeoR family transcriptional regulator [Priestia taiwanensis]
MLTPERHELILNMIRRQGIVKLQDLVRVTETSESTIRRDLSLLENNNLLKRVHGGASLLQSKGIEPTMHEKSGKNLVEKQQVAAFAAALVNEGDCIFLDAGSTTYEMIPYLAKKNVTVVTNGLMHIELLADHDITAYLLGGKIKGLTKALVGSQALESMMNYRFDKCFLGANGIHCELGYTTPDPEEALVKKSALKLSGQKYILADHSKFSEVSFSKFASIDEATIITNEMDDEILSLYENKTLTIKVGKK